MLFVFVSAHKIFYCFHYKGTGSLVRIFPSGKDGTNVFTEFSLQKMTTPFYTALTANVVCTVTLTYFSLLKATLYNIRLHIWPYVLSPYQLLF